jgi:hypothetical protein
MSVAIAVRGEASQVGHLPEPPNGFRPATIYHRGRGRKAGKLDISGDVCEPSRLAIQKQLSHIFRSEQFVRAKRMRRFLTYIIDETLAGRREEISEYSIGIAVFDRPESFEPGLDPIVRNEARRLRQKLSEYYQGIISGAHGVVIEIPKGGYVPAFHLIQADGAPKVLRVSVTVSGGPSRPRIWEQEYQISDYSAFRLELDITGISTREIEAAGPNA